MILYKRNALWFEKQQRLVKVSSDLMNRFCIFGSIIFLWLVWFMDLLISLNLKYFEHMTGISCCCSRCVVMSLRFALRIWHCQCWLLTFAIAWKNHEVVAIVADMLDFNMLMSFWKPNNIRLFHHWPTNETFTFKSKSIPLNTFELHGWVWQWGGRPAQRLRTDMFSRALASPVDIQV